MMKIKSNEMIKVKSNEVTKINTNEMIKHKFNEIIKFNSNEIIVKSPFISQQTTKSFAQKSNINVQLFKKKKI